MIRHRFCGYTHLFLIQMCKPLRVPKMRWRAAENKELGNSQSFPPPNGYKFGSASGSSLENEPSRALPPPNTNYTEIPAVQPDPPNGVRRTAGSSPNRPLRPGTPSQTAGRGTPNDFRLDGTRKTRIQDHLREGMKVLERGANKIKTAVTRHDGAIQQIIRDANNPLTKADHELVKSHYDALKAFFDSVKDANTNVREKLDIILKMIDALDKIVSEGGTTVSSEIVKKFLREAKKLVTDATEAAGSGPVR